MNSKLVTSCLLAGAMMLPISGYTADGDTDRSSPKTWVKDSAITTKIKAKLAGEKMSSLIHVKVDTDNKGVVNLSGFVGSQSDSDRVVAIARGEKGVTFVQNDLQIKADK